MLLEPIRVTDAPAPIAPYSQAIKAGDFLFVSGQGPVDPATGQIVRGPIENQVRRTMDNIAAILRGAGATFANVAKVTMYLSDVADFAAASKVYGTYFDGPPPARTAIQAGGLPMQIGIEIECIAYMPAH